MEESFCGELGDVGVSAVSCGGHGDGDPRLCCLKVTSAGMEKREEGAGLHHGCLESLTLTALPPVFTVDLSSQVPGQEWEWVIVLGQLLRMQDQASVGCCGSVLLGCET